MKSIKLASLLVVVVALTLGSTGCQKRPVGLTKIPKTGYRVGEGSMTPGSTLTPADNGTGSTGFGSPLPTFDPNDPNLIHDKQTLAAHVVHFEYDSSVVKSSEKGNVSAVAAYLASNAGVYLLVEGHCDERGTEEYNRALGERRALALREALVGDGADGMRITTRSFGEDHPVAPGHDESAYSQNRRGEFVVLRQK